jgi:hypothetical protein
VNSKPLSKVGPLPAFVSLLLEEVDEKITSVNRNLCLQLGGGRKGGRGEGVELDKMFLIGGAFLEEQNHQLKDSYNGNQCTLILIRM